MPAYKDTDQNTWFTKFYYTDWQGVKKQKKKRGFNTKREALEFERDFLNKQTADTNITFGNLTSLYLEDMKSRLRVSTMANKQVLIDKKILPYFKDMAISDIKPTQIRKWQNELLNSDYSPTYIKTINNQLVAIFNYAVKYYELHENPCHKAGSIGKKNADEMQFWTKEEFKTFLPCVADKPVCKLAYEVLYWTGIRIGELFALTPADIDFNTNLLTINKSLQRIEKEDIITEPKTPKSNRVIALPQFLINDLKEYLNKIYELQDNERIFNFTKFFLHHEMDRGCKKSGVKKIRLHDLRHSHASLLIELGFSPLLIAERLGHEKVETTLNTYSHLYPHKQCEVAEKLQLLNN